MTRDEFEILDALNIASTIHRDRARGFMATAAQIAEVGRDDPRMGFEWMTAASVGARLGRMAKGWPTRRAPLVERVSTRRWRLTDAGLGVLIA